MGLVPNPKIMTLTQTHYLVLVSFNSTMGPNFNIEILSTMMLHWLFLHTKSMLFFFHLWCVLKGSDWVLNEERPILIIIEPIESALSTNLQTLLISKFYYILKSSTFVKCEIGLQRRIYLGGGGARALHKVMQYCFVECHKWNNPQNKKWSLTISKWEESCIWVDLSSIHVDSICLV